MIKRGAYILIFVLGVVLGSFISSSGIIKASDENPFSNTSPEIRSPYDWIKEGQIHVLDNRIVIEVENPVWAKFTDTNSMDPIIDYNANALQIVPKTVEDIHVGDIISYESQYAEGIIIHRVIGIQNDSDGKYFIVKGDNNPSPDPGKVRFSQIKKVLIGIIY